MNNEIRKVVVVGAGPAGVAAAVQLRRSGFDPLLIERRRIGGLVWNAQIVANYPGFPDGISGKGLADLMAQQLAVVGVIPCYGEVREIELEDGFFIVRTSDKTINCRSIIIASGTIPILFDKIANDPTNGHVFYEVADAAEMTGKQIAVIGGSDTAFDYALQLVDRSCSVEIFVRGEQHTCLEILWQRASQHPHITTRFNRNVSGINLRNDKVHISGLEPEPWGYEVDLVFIAIGREPNNRFLSAKLRNRSPMSVVTSVPGLYFAGDVIRKNYRQVGISVGDGLYAAMACARYLKNEAL